MRIAMMPDGKPEIYATIQGEGATIGKPVIFVRTSGCNLMCNWCFPANTLISTPGGKKKIKDIKVDDEVLSSNKDNKIEIKKVTKLFQRKVVKEDLVKIVAETKTVFCTKNHEFFTNKGWVQASNLTTEHEIHFIDQSNWFMTNNNPSARLESKQRLTEQAKKTFGRIKHTLDHRLKNSLAKQGEKNPRYLGVTSSNTNGYLTMWHRVRNDILERDNHTCQNKECGATERLEVHHIIPYRISKSNDLNNLITLCKFCHLQVEKSLIHNGKKVISVTEITTKQAARFNNNSKEIDVYNFEVEDNHTYFANNLLVHNCDTFYTWNFDDIPRKNPHLTQAPVKREDYVKEMTVDEVVVRIEEIGKDIHNAVFTGGEPTIQQDDLALVAAKLKEHNPDWYFEIETNGTNIIRDPLANQLNQINSSPKLLSSGNNPLAKNRPQAIKRLLEIHSKGAGLCFKFVIMKEKWEADLQEVKDWQKFHNVPSNLIFLMPEGITRERIQESSVFLSEIAQKEGYNLSTRLQVLMFGTKRAV